MEVTSQVASTRPTGAVSHLALITDSQIRFLSSARLRNGLTAAGCGRLEYDGLAVTRWTGDEVCGRDGVFVYVRDLDDGRFWSATWQPTVGEPDGYEVDFQASCVQFVRQDFDIRVETEVQMDSESDVELRRCTITNAGKRRRRIEVTSYLEWVLQDAAADYAHPAFSKLFVETEYLAELQAIVARRRQRDPRQAILCGAHWIAECNGRPLRNATEFETCRADFVGRGRDLRAPLVLSSERQLAGNSGPVLDPIASLRRSFVLHPDESATITFATAARNDADSLINLIQHGVEWNAGQHQAPSACTDSLSLNASPPNGDAFVSHAPKSYRIDAPHMPATAMRYRRLQERPSRQTAAANAVRRESLEFDNGLGGFTKAGDEYVIRLQPDADGNLRLPPLPWTHVVANPQAGFIATELGAGYTWTSNSRENRLTPWSNDPVSDPHSEALYFRDAEQGAYWSPLPGPAISGAPSEVRYGFGYAKYQQNCVALNQRVLQFVPMDAPVKISRIHVENLSAQSRTLDLFAYAHLALGNGTRASAEGIRTWFDETSSALLATNANRELSQRVAFAALFAPLATGNPHITTDRVEFIGPQGDLAEPLALATSVTLSGKRETLGDACFALQQSIQLAPRQAGECWLLLGEADTVADARRIIASYSSAEQLDAAIASVEDFWQDKLGAVQVETPSQAMNFMVNGWLPYQNISCRLWGRSAYYQSGGAFGFRDQLQDAAALAYHWPEATREQILRHAASQFVEGDVLHWWHPPAQRGIRTRFADDLLWLPLLTSEYCSTTGDVALWDEQADYITGPQLEPDEAERFFQAEPSGQSGTIYEHCCRAIDRSLAVGFGAHGLPLMGCGDWNDGMNRIGEGGRGESVWMGFFLYQALEKFLPICLSRGDAERAEEYRTVQLRLRDALNSSGWDGQWYRRAFFDDGEAVGTAAAAECQIDALAQAWAVLSGAGDGDKAEQAIAAVEERLVDQQAGLIRLLDPPFVRMAHDPGYIKGYVPGVRENGGQYTHGVLWYVRALAELGRGSRAVELLDMINPIHHGRTPAEVATYQAEPYVVAADVYSQPPHVGRAGWTWYTGSAGWMWRVAVESILGLRIKGGRTLLVNPAISRVWPACEFRYQTADSATSYHIRIENPHGRETGATMATLDGAEAVVNNGTVEIPLRADGRIHHVTVHL